MQSVSAQYLHDRSLFFEKIKKIDKPLVIVTRQKREKTEITGIRNEGENITANLTKRIIKKITRNHCVLHMTEARDVRTGSGQTEEKLRSCRTLKHNLLFQKQSNNKMVSRSSLSIART